MLQTIIIVLISIILYFIINCIRRIDKIDSKFILTQNNKSVLLHIDNKRIVLMPYKGLKLYKSVGLFKSNYHSLYNEKDNINKDTKEVFIFKSIKDIEKITKDCEEDENLLNFIRLSHREYIITKHQLSWLHQIRLKKRDKVITILMKIVNERLQSLIDEGDGRSTTYLDYNQVYQKVKDEGYELTQNDLNHLTLILKENEWIYTSLSPSKMRISDTKDEPFDPRC